jgi:hypothetical protein
LLKLLISLWLVFPLRFLSVGDPILNSVLKTRTVCLGKEEGQLWYPRKVAVARQTGKYIVCDRGNERSRMQIFQKNGHFIKKIAIRYIDIVAGMAISNLGEQLLYNIKA